MILKEYMLSPYNYIYYENPIYSVFDRVTRETRILVEDEIIDISVIRVPISPEILHGVRYSFNYRIRTKEGWKTLIRSDNAHRIKGHKKRDHKHMFENEAQEFEFISPKDLIDELLKLIDDNRRIINEIKRR